VARQPPCVVRPQTFCADEGSPETTTESSPRLGHVSVRFSVVFQSAMNASATVLHINALRLLHCADIMLPFGRMLGGVPVARHTGSDEVRFSAAVDFNPQIHSPAGESSVHRIDTMLVRWYPQRAAVGYSRWTDRSIHLCFKTPRATFTARGSSVMRPFIGIQRAKCRSSDL
jgi:hypothetical protein